MENETNRLIEYGMRYQSMLEKMKVQRQDYARFRSQLGTLEMKVLEDGCEPAMTLPDLPPISECTSKIAENLLNTAEKLAFRPNRIPVPIDREEIPSYRLAVDGDDEFSPERFTREIIDQLKGSKGACNHREVICYALGKVFLDHLKKGTTPVIKEASSKLYGDARMLDAVSSMRAFEALAAVATVVEMKQVSSEALRSFDDWLSDTDRSGRGRIYSRMRIGDDQYSVALSLRGKSLFIRPSNALSILIQDYAA